MFTSPGPGGPDEDGRPFNLSPILVLDQDIKGEMKHGNDDGPEGSLQDALCPRRQDGDLAVAVVAVVAAVLVVMLAVGSPVLLGYFLLALGSLSEQVIVLIGDFEQRFF